MFDFTLYSYKKYLLAIKTNKIQFYLFKDFLSSKVNPEKFCLIRHDVDRWPKRALKMAKIENEMNIKSTYYFRVKKHTFNPELIKKIYKLGHEIGYHYESLSDANGNEKKAIEDFKNKLKKLRDVVPVQTCAMHGMPLKKYDNRDLWKSIENQNILKKEFQLLGEVYLDIDYTNILYINDTGRNWTNTASNLRDKVDSKMNRDFSSGKELLSYLRDNPHEKIIFQIHPERWSSNALEFFVSWSFDFLVNILKEVFKYKHKFFQNGS